MPERTAHAHWEGPINAGHGSIAVARGVFESEYSFGSVPASRIEKERIPRNCSEQLRPLFQHGTDARLVRSWPPTTGDRHDGPRSHRKGARWLSYHPYRAST